MLRSTTGTRFDTDLRDVPHSLSIVPRELLDHTMAVSRVDALTCVPNAQPRPNPPDGVMIRGILLGGGLTFGLLVVAALAGEVQRLNRLRLRKIA